MPASTLIDVSDERIFTALAEGETVMGAARLLGVSFQSLKRAVATRGLTERAAQEAAADHIKKASELLGEKPSLTLKGDEGTLISEVSPEDLGDIEDLLRARGLNPEDWIITNVVVNKWSAMTSDKKTGDNRVVPMHQLKIGLRRKVSMMLVSPARHVPPVKLKRALKLSRRDAPKHTLIEGDNQAPYHCRPLDSAMLALLAWLQPEEHIFLGDTMDFPTISKYMDHPAVTAAVQECIDSAYGILRSRADASPTTRRRKLKGNHDFRIESEQLLRSERMYGIHPAGEQIAALDIRRLLHLEALGIELVTDIRGWEHAEIEIVPGQRGLVSSHGWTTGTNAAERSMKSRGRSQIVGHTHRRELVYWWDPSSEVERIGATVGCMCEVRGGGDGRYPHYVKLDRWLQGAAIVSTWPDDRFEIEHVRWDGETLTWRNERFRP